MMVRIDRTASCGPPISVVRDAKGVFDGKTETVASIRASLSVAPKGQPWDPVFLRKGNTILDSWERPTGAARGCQYEFRPRVRLSVIHYGLTGYDCISPEGLVGTIAPEKSAAAVGEPGRRDLFFGGADCDNLGPTLVGRKT